MKWISLLITSILVGAAVSYVGQMAFPALVEGRFLTVAAVATLLTFLLNVGMGQSNHGTQR